MHAPNLAGLGYAYLVQQLRKFRAAHRGNESDSYGFMMIGRANALPGDRGIRDVAAFVDSLPVHPSSSAGHRQRQTGPRAVLRLRGLPWHQRRRQPVAWGAVPAPAG